MKKQILGCKVWLVAVFCFLVSFPGAKAVASPRNDRHGGSSRKVVIVKHDKHNYRDMRFYHPAWWGVMFSVLVNPKPVVRTNVVYLPVVEPVQTICSETITINVPNTNGSYTPVTLVRRNNGYIGPQGEYYPGNPTVEQLKLLYGR